MADLPFGLDHRPWKHIDEDDEEQSSLYDFEKDSEEED